VDDNATKTLDDLKEQLPDLVVRPGDAGWDAARAAWNPVVDQHPAAVAWPASSKHVVQLVDAARAPGCASPRNPPATPPARWPAWRTPSW
jgi:hypothetical protein